MLLIIQEREKRRAEEARLKAEKEIREKKRKEEEIKEIQVKKNYEINSSFVGRQGPKAWGYKNSIGSIFIILGKLNCQ